MQVTRQDGVDVTSRRPRLALVLGSGGVRGMAAVGLMARLEREGLAPDVIVGCSSGALFGAALALGWSAVEARVAIASMWSQDLTQHRRWRALPELLMPKLARFGEGFGLRDNRGIARRLREGFGSARIESLPIPLRVVVTHARTGEPVVLERGPVSQAVLASMAVPVIFPSVEFEGARYVDGVISDPLPIAAAGDADVVLALGFEGAMPRRVNRLSRLAARTSTALINNLMHARLDAAHARGQRIVELEVQVPSRVGLWETSAFASIYDAGEAMADEAMPRILGALASDDGLPPPRSVDRVPPRRDLHMNFAGLACA